MTRDPARVLVVDDDARALAEVACRIEGQGMRVVACAAAGAADLLARAAADDHDLLVIDADSGNAGGSGLLRRVTGDPRFRHVPVIVLSAAATPRQVREGLASGVFCYLAKSCDVEVMRTAARAGLAERRARLASSGGGIAQPARLAVMPVGRFELRTLEEARWLSSFLATQFPDPATAGVGLLELIVNAVEHGNLGISTEEKSRLLGRGAWEREVNRRLELDANAAKRVRVDLRRDARSVTVVISDEGPGFDWAAFGDLDPSRARAPNGRGIALARRLAFPALEYLGCGNQVRVTAPLPHGDAAMGADASERGMTA